MITTIGAFVATTTGKIVLGTAVAAASVGGAHAADIVDVPGMERAPVVVEIEGELPVADEAPDTLVGDDVLPEELNVQDEQGGEDAVDVVEGDEVESEDADDAMNSDDGDTSDEDTGDKPDNHGQVVSDFVHSTDLEGCEKGQAVAALASSKVNENQDGDKESPKKSAEDRADKCNNDEQDADDEDGEELDVDADGEDGEDEAAEEAEKPAKADQQAGKADGKADGKATGKPEWAESKGKKSDRS